MTAAAAGLSTPRPEPKRDRYERYLLPHPISGKEQAWTRATTFAKTISDMFGLGEWEKRMVAKGIAMRHDLYLLAAATSIDDKKTLDRICKDAKEAAKASSGANLGTALHAFTEALDAGETVEVPAPWDADVAAYRTATTAARITMHPYWIERVVVVPELQVAGTLDRIVTLGDGRLVIGDVKTGKSLDWSWGEIAIQLALYANASHLWNQRDDCYEDMPAVDKDTAVVLHLPVGKATCDLYEVNIGSGSEGAMLCARVRAWRTEARKLAQPYRFDSVLARIQTAPDRAALEHIWAEVASFGQWTDQHTQAAKQRAAHLASAEPGGTQEKEKASTAA